MPRRTLRSLVALAVAAGALGAALPEPAGGQGIVIGGAPPTNKTATRLDQLMAPWELDATGIARLSAAERAALEAWLGRYTAALRAERAGPATGTRPGAPAPMDTIRPAPGPRPAAPEVPGTRSRPARIALSIDPSPSSLEIVAVYEGGDLIATDDGSLWETYLPDRPKAASWEVGQSVLVRANPLPTQLSGPPFEVVLMNAETRTTATARYAGQQPAEGDTSEGR